MAAWRDVRVRSCELLTRKLEQVSTIRLVAEDTDLTVGVGGRTWIASQGLRNFPDGEVFTGPVEDETNGDMRFSFPAIIGGREVDGRAAALRGRPGGHERGRDAARSYLRRRCSRWTTGPRCWASSPSAPTTASAGSPSRSCSTRRSAAPCTWRWARATRTRAASTARRCTGTWCCDLRGGGEIYADGELIYSRRASSCRIVLRADPGAADYGLTGVSRAHQPAHPGDVCHERQVVQAQHCHAQVRGHRRRPLPCPRARDSGSPSGSAVTSLCEQRQQQRIAEPDQRRQMPQRVQVGGGVLAEPESGVDQDRVGWRRPPQPPSAAREVRKSAISARLRWRSAGLRLLGSQAEMGDHESGAVPRRPPRPCSGSLRPVWSLTRSAPASSAAAATGAR